MLSGQIFMVFHNPSGPIFGLHPTPFSVHYLLIIISLNTEKYDIFEVSLNKLRINKTLRFRVTSEDRLTSMNFTAT